MLTTWNIIWNLIDFIVLVFLLLKYLRKPVTDAIAKKQDKIANSISTIEVRLNDVTLKFESQIKQLDDVKKEIKKIEEQSQVMAEKLREEIVKAAGQEAEKIKEHLKKTMEQDLNRTKSELRKEVVDKALVRAQEIVNQKLDMSTQLNLIQGFAMSLNPKSSDN